MQIELRPITEADGSQMAAWRANPELQKRLRHPEFLYVPASEHEFAVTLDGELMGRAGLCHVTQHTGELSAYIGTSEKWLLHPVIDMVVAYGFKMGLQAIWAERLPGTPDEGQEITRHGFTGAGRILILERDKWLGITEG